MDYISDSFYHFTPKIEYLYNIIKTGFYPRYCIEDFDYLLKENKKNNRPTTIAIPMVCFCDIPIKFTKEHVNDYGEFAIAMKKEWGLRHLNPIFYLTENSLPQKKLELVQWDLMGEIKRKGTNDDTEISNEIIEMFYHFQDFIAYFKRYKGTSSKHSSEEKIFYREREWRWIPEQNEDARRNKVILRLEPSEYQNICKKNKELEKYYTLPFEITDIDYLIVNSNMTKKELEKFILTLGEEKHTLLNKIHILDGLLRDNIIETA